MGSVTQAHTKKWMIPVVVAVAVIVMLAAVSASQSDGTANQNVVDGTPLFKVLSDQGENSTPTDWLATLTDEQMAAVDIAYESSLEEGYKGTKEEWVSTQVVAHPDSRGDIVVTLPDGGEFVWEKLGKTQEAESNDDEEAKDQKSSEEHDEKSNEGSSSDSSSQQSTSGSTSGDAPTITVDCAQAHQGGQGVAVPVQIEDNPGVLGMTFSVSYDESALTLVNAENGDVFADALTMTHSRSYASGCLFTWDGVELDSEDVRDGTILTLYFDVAKEAKTGTYPIAVRVGGSAFDKDLQGVELSVQDGSIVVS